jgi:biotin-dependent carboxylase-like uncharacterized protein
VSLVVLAPGPLALVQDRGRPGLAGMGVGRSGAADRAAHDLANRLVANPPDAATVEVTLGGLRVRAQRAVVLAVTGAPAPAEVDGTPVGHAAVLRLRAGQELVLGVPAVGLRSYLAVRGGVDVAPVLGSRATDVLSGLGPAPLAAGAVLPVGPPPAAVPLLDQAPVAVPAAGRVVLRVRRGPRADRVDGDVVGRGWTVSSRSDRVGVRLERTGPEGAEHAGPEGAERAGPEGAEHAGLAHRPGLGELPSEGVVRGAVQVPPGGEPVLFLADHPVTGGYPVVAVVLDADVDLAAQLRPGQAVVFRAVPGVFRVAP